MNVVNVCKPCNLALKNRGTNIMFCDNCLSEYEVENEIVKLKCSSNPFIEEYNLKFAHHEVNVKRYLKTLVLQHSLEMSLFYSLLDFIESVDIIREQYLLNIIYQSTSRFFWEQKFREVQKIGYGRFYSSLAKFSKSLKTNDVNDHKLEESWFKTSISTIEPSDYRKESIYFKNALTAYNNLFTSYLKKSFEDIYDSKSNVAPPKNIYIGGTFRDKWAICSDNNCPCPQTIIGRGRGYIAIVKYSEDYYKGIVCCEQGAKLRKLDLRMAHNDMLLWWDTGTIPARESIINLDPNQKSVSSDVFLQETIEEKNKYLKYIKEYIKANEKKTIGDYKVIFDTETSGLPGIRNSNACVIQLAWVVLDDKNEIVERQKYLFKPTSRISPEAEKIHGISQAYAEINGVDKKIVLKDFLTIILGAIEIIGHNVAFDLEMIKLEIRENLDLTFREQDEYISALSLKTKFCTMIESKEFCQLYLDGRLKPPKLSELHDKLFHSDFNNAHDAMTDVEVTYKCYKELLKRSLV